MNNDKHIQPVNLQLIQASYDKDALTPQDIFRILFAHRYSILTITLVSGLLMLAYGFLQKDVYQAEALLSAPRESDIVDLNVVSEQYNVNNVHEEFYRNFNSRAIRKKFFDEYNLGAMLEADGETIDDVEGFFNNRFDMKLTVEKGAFGGKVARFQEGNAETAAEILNSFIAYVNDKSVQQLKFNESRLLTRKIEEHKIRKSSLHENALRKKEDQVSILKEALVIAKQLNVDGADESSINAATATRSEDNSVIGIDLSLFYTRGVEPLTAELEALQKWKKVELFVPAIRTVEMQIIEKETKLDFLKNSANIRTVLVDKEAFIPKSPIRPRKVQLALIGLAIGLSLSFLHCLLFHTTKTSTET
jgi:chain length determinant protein (polysaccharide antigen chain regulator)